MTSGAFGWVLVGAGVLLPLGILLTINRWSTQTSWNPAKAVIIDSVVAYDGEQYVARVTYEYYVAGQTFRGMFIRAGTVLYNWREPADRICQQYSPGTAVTAYVDPTDPQRAVLEPGGDTHLIPLSFGVGIVLVIVGGAVAASSE